MNWNREMEFMKARRQAPRINRIPEWAKAEHMEMSQPLEMLWNLPDREWKPQRQLPVNHGRLLWRMRIHCAYRLYLLADRLNPVEVEEAHA